LTHVLNHRLLTIGGLRHFWPALFFLFLAIITLREFIFGDFIFEHRDIIWPYEIDNLISWIISTTNLDWTRRALAFLPLFSLIDVLGLPAIFAEKALFILSRFFMGFFMYYLVYKFLSVRLGKSINGQVFFISIFAGFFYSYNPMTATYHSADAIQAFSYSLIPLAFYFFDRALVKQNFRSVFLAAFLISLSVSAIQQYLVLLPAFVLLPWLILVCLQKWYSKEKIWPVVKNSLYVLLFVVLMSSYWIVPTISIMYEGIIPQPKYVATTNILNIISSETTFLNAFRLLGDWWPRVEIPPIVDDRIWIVLSFAIPLCVVSFILVLKKSKLKYYVLSFSIISLYIMFFHKGVQDPFPDFYLFLFNLPIFGWIFRVPSSIGQFLAFFITIILSLGFYGIVTQFKPRLHFIKYIPLFYFGHLNLLD